MPVQVHSAAQVHLHKQGQLTHVICKTSNIDNVTMINMTGAGHEPHEAGWPIRPFQNPGDYPVKS
jgi:hypothetical protein